MPSTTPELPVDLETSAGCLPGQKNHHHTCAEAMAKFAEPQKPRTLVNAKERVPRTRLWVTMLKPPRISHAVLSCGQYAKSRGCGEVGRIWGRRCTQGAEIPPINEISACHEMLVLAFSPHKG